jgi:hypothetical protein
MSVADRKAVGQLTMEEASKRFVDRNERVQHQLLCGWLDMNGFVYIHANPVKKSTIQVGAPDFIVFYAGKSVFLELKGPEGKLSQDQIDFIHRLVKVGFYTHIPRSASEAITIIKQWKRILDERQPKPL